MQQPTVTTVNGRRTFTCFPAAVLVFIVNANEEILMLSHPQRNGWEVVNGGMEAGESVLEAALRETAEEAGERVRIRPLGAINVSNFHYDDNVRYMFSIAYLAAYEGGAIEPGDDMTGSDFCWMSLETFAKENMKILVPVPYQHWLPQRAIELYRLWKDQDVTLQIDLEQTRNYSKYAQ